MSTSQGWTPTATAPQIANWLNRFGRILIVTHAKPDGDALGSTLAITRALNLRAKNAGVPGRVATPWYSGVMPTWADSVFGDTRTEHTDDGLPHQAKFDAVLVCDTGSWNQVDVLGDVVRSLTPNVAIVDHHRQGNPDMGETRLLETHAAAAAQPAADIACAILGTEDRAKLPASIAEPLFLGLATDTGWFRHSSVDAGVFSMASDLMKAGVDADALYRLVYQQDRASRPKLLGRALSNMELLDNGRVALLPISIQDMHDCHAGPGDTGGLTDPALAIATVKVAIAMTEVHLGADEHTANPGHHVKLSLRSKVSDDFVDVSEVAQRLGGGGHSQAAGARVEGTIADARHRVLEALGLEANA
ncbi:MAG: DHH family phosphoesterase [Planctomycetota bacterium]